LSPPSNPAPTRSRATNLPTHQNCYVISQQGSSRCNMPYASRIALLISCLSVLAAYWVSENIYERTPHVEDEFAYIWQAQVFAHGQAYMASPVYPTLFVVPFVVD